MAIYDSPFFIEGMVQLDIKPRRRDLAEAELSERTKEYLADSLGRDYILSEEIETLFGRLSFLN